MDNGLINGGSPGPRGLQRFCRSRCPISDVAPAIIRCSCFPRPMRRRGPARRRLYIVDKPPRPAGFPRGWRMGPLSARPRRLAASATCRCSRTSTPTPAWCWDGWISPMARSRLKRRWRGFGFRPMRAFTPMALPTCCRSSPPIGRTSHLPKGRPRTKIVDKFTH